MQAKRTTIDFSKHVLTVDKDTFTTIYRLAIPGTVTNSLKFINTCGILAVTGDFGNWIFCREFHPSATGQVSDGYWMEKLQIASTQQPEEFDSEVAKKQIERLLKPENADGYDWSEEDKEWLNELSDEADGGEYAYIAKIMDRPSGFDSEYIPDGKRTNFWLEVVFDGFDEMCRRVAQEEPK